MFLSLDHGNEQFEEYFGMMPWLAIELKDKERTKLMSKYGVDGIPTLVVLNDNCESISPDGREAVEEDSSNSFEEWLTGKPKVKPSSKCKWSGYYVQYG